MFNAVYVEKDDDGYRAGIRSLESSQLPEGNVTIDVAYSTLNYKDALAITGAGPVVRSFPMVPGIDVVGTVESSSSERFKTGDTVLLNGWGVGEMHWGGLAQKARFPDEWLIHLPEQITPLQSMAIGTAGYTAMLCVMALEKQGVTPDKGEILVTGAAGGVGSIAILLLSKLGYQVVASTGRPHEAQYLKDLGCAEIIDRSTLSEPGRPLNRARWSGAIDTVGSHTLANVCASIQYRGVVTACGLAQGMDFPASVAPFILRGVSLIGIDSVQCPREDRIKAWNRLAKDLDFSKLELISSEVIGLEQALRKSQDLLDGKVRGRVIVDVNK